MLSGKAGLVHVHMGAGPTMLQPLREALALSDVPITQFWPTHMDRNEPLMRDGLRWIEEGGCIDFTAGENVCTWPNFCPVPAHVLFSTPDTAWCR